MMFHGGLEKHQKQLIMSVNEETDLTNPPKYDNVLDEIQQVILGELQLVDTPGEVIKIHDWQPKIVTD